MDFLRVALIVYLAIMNVVAFAVYGIDKARAKRSARRVSERVLLLLAFAGGAVGALAGMLAFRHKIRKPRFFIGVPIALVLVLTVGGGLLFVSDYCHADDTALAAVRESSEADGVEVRQVEGRYLAFVPDNPRIGMVFYPGGRIQPESYAPLLRRCAQQGVMCVLVKPPLNLAILDTSLAAGAVAAFPDVEHWILAGHSLGGVSASEHLASHLDDFEGMVFLAAYPSSDLTGFDGCVSCVYGSVDDVLNRDRYDEAWKNLPADTREIVIDGGNHAQFGNYGEQAGDGTATISREEQQSQVVQEVLHQAEELTQSR